MASKTFESITSESLISFFNMLQSDVSDQDLDKWINCNENSIKSNSKYSIFILLYQVKDVKTLSRMFKILYKNRYENLGPFLATALSLLNEKWSKKELEFSTLQKSRDIVKQDLKDRMQILKNDSSDAAAHRIGNYLKRTFQDELPVESLEFTLTHSKTQSSSDKRHKMKNQLDKILQVENLNLISELNQPDSNSEIELINTFYELIRNHPDWAEDLSMGMYIMGLEHHALNVGSQLPSSISTLSLRTEILLSMRRYLEVLSVCDIMLNMYRDNPDMQIYSQYNRALAFKGLNKNSEAIFIMNEIHSVRPRYRLVDYYLGQWDKK